MEEKIMGTQQTLTTKEQQILTLFVVEQCIKYAKETGKTFEEVLNEDVFANEASTDFAEMICKNIDSLSKDGYISGTVELEYEIEIDAETFEEEKTDNINFAECTFDNIEINTKGKAYMAVDNLKTLGKDFYKKSIPLLKCIATSSLEKAVECAFIAIMRNAGFTV